MECERTLGRLAAPELTGDGWVVGGDSAGEERRQRRQSLLKAAARLNFRTLRETRALIRLRRAELDALALRAGNDRRSSAPSPAEGDEGGRESIKPTDPLSQMEARAKALAVEVERLESRGTNGSLACDAPDHGW